MSIFVYTVGTEQLLVYNFGLLLTKNNQRTNGPVNVHLISGPTVSTKTIFAKFYRLNVVK